MRRHLQNRLRTLCARITAPEPILRGILVEDQIHKDIAKAAKQPPAEYRIPPLSLLQKGKAATGDSSRELKRDRHALAADVKYFRCKGNDHRYQSGSLVLPAMNYNRSRA